LTFGALAEMIGVGGGFGEEAKRRGKAFDLALYDVGARARLRARVGVYAG
jgi:hypothetical protein